MQPNKKNMGFLFAFAFVWPIIIGVWIENRASVDLVSNAHAAPFSTKGNAQTLQNCANGSAYTLVPVFNSGVGALNNNNGTYGNTGGAFASNGVGTVWTTGPSGGTGSQSAGYNSRYQGFTVCNAGDVMIGARTVPTNFNSPYWFSGLAVGIVCCSLN